MVTLDNSHVNDPARADDFRLVVDLIAEPVQRYLARRIDAATADDVFSETLLVCWRRLDKVPRTGDGSFGDEAVAWSIAVARNLVSNARRAERRRTRLVGKIIALDPPRAVTEPPHDDARRDRMRAALARLRPADAELIRLWAWDGLESPSLATVLGISANAAAIRLHRAKARLRAELLADDDALKSARPAGHVKAEGGSDDARF